MMALFTLAATALYVWALFASFFRSLATGEAWRSFLLGAGPGLGLCAALALGGVLLGVGEFVESAGIFAGLFVKGGFGGVFWGFPLHHAGAKLIAALSRSDVQEQPPQQGET